MNRITRFDPLERAIHWAAALTFLYTALTGLSMWSHKLFWMAAVFGGGSTVRAMHPWGGLVFALALACMIRQWAGQMKLTPGDRIWLKMAHRYAVHDGQGMPESGRFNGGQKALFWMQSFSAGLLLASGAVLWFPESPPRTLLLAAVLVHPIAAIVSTAGLILHVYMGTAAVPGALRGMLQGWVTPGWARSHHARWSREAGSGGSSGSSRED